MEYFFMISLQYPFKDKNKRKSESNAFKLSNEYFYVKRMQRYKLRQNTEYFIFYLLRRSLLWGL
jgi:hypothetical protein